ncbi:MAG TPA: phosphomannomutase/phosphoglucomutase [Moraxellaceae bacterium]|nr:phosphomannomutase/phosphoglucomutase [Moraxellaceae bacterium]
MATKKSEKAKQPVKAGKAPKEAAPKAPKAAKVAGEGTPLKDGLPALLIMVVVLAVIQAAGWWMVSQAEQTRRDEIAGVYRQHYVAILTAYLHSYEDGPKSVPDAELLPLMQPGAVAGNDLVKRFPGASFALVSPLVLDPAVPNGLSFAQQDMLARAASGKAMHPEISFYDAGTVKAQVVTYARVLKGADGQPAGALLVGYPFAPLATALKGFAPDAGVVELTQKVGNDKASILKSGASDTPPTDSGTTPNPAWELHFTPAPTLGRSHESGFILLVFVLVAPLVAGGLFLWAVMRIQRRAQDDLAGVSGYCENLFHYGNRQRPALSYAMSAKLLGELDRFGAELRAGRAAVKPASDELGEIAGGDASDLFGAAAKPARRPAPPPAEPAVVEEAPAEIVVAPEIFRAYDVRGVVGKGLNAQVARLLGQAIGSEASARGEQTVVVGRDGRLSGPELVAALVEGLRASGRDVIDVGMVPTPVLYFAAKTIGTGSGVMVTGSHNPADYNGFKIMLAGDTLAGDEIQSLRTRIDARDFVAGSGALTQTNVAQDYVDRVNQDIALARPLNVVVDAGNGAAGPIAMRVLEAMGCNVVPLFCEVDGHFPNHHPDPSKPENLEDLTRAVAANNADVGIAFDGDGDRIGVVTPSGKMIFPDRLMMLYAKHVLTSNPGADIIFDVKCTRDLAALISRLGGRPVMCKTGHSFIKGKLKETGAVLAGEMSGHIFFNDRWFGFDDAVYSASRLLEILSLETGDADAVFGEFPENPSTPEINIPVADDRKFGLMAELQSRTRFPDANVITIDGVRVEFADGWGLIRASNTTPCLVARFEGKTPEALVAVQGKFRALLASVDANLQIPF